MHTPTLASMGGLVVLVQFSPALQPHNCICFVCLSRAYTHSLIAKVVYMRLQCSWLCRSSPACFLVALWRMFCSKRHLWKDKLLKLYTSLFLLPLLNVMHRFNKLPCRVSHVPLEHYVAITTLVSFWWDSSKTQKDCSALQHEKS